MATEVEITKYIEENGIRQQPVWVAALWYKRLNLSESAKNLLFDDLQYALSGCAPDESDMQPAMWELLAKGLVEKDYYRGEPQRDAHFVISPTALGFMAIEMMYVERQLEKEAVTGE